MIVGQVLRFPIIKEVLEGVRGINTLISIMRMVRSLEKESQLQNQSRLGYRDYTNESSLFAKFANTSFSG